MENQGKIIYSNDLVLSPQTIQMDQVYGIYQSRKQKITIDWTTKVIDYEENYYYSKESGYVETKSRKKVTNFNGTIKIQGDKVVASIEGKYLQYAMEEEVVQVDINKEQVKGEMILQIVPNGIKIVQVKLEEKGEPFQTYFKEVIEFKKI